MVWLFEYSWRLMCFGRLGRQAHGQRPWRERLLSSSCKLPLAVFSLHRTDTAGFTSHHSTQLFCCSFTAWLIITRPSNSDARRSEAVTALTMMMTRRMTLNGVLPLNSRVSWWGLKIGFHRLNEDIWGGEIKVTPKFLEKKKFSWIFRCRIPDAQLCATLN